MNKETTEIRDMDAIPMAERADWHPIPDAEVDKVRAMNKAERKKWLLASQKGQDTKAVRQKQKRRAAGKAARKARRTNRGK